jgi:hypothetical protein
VPCEKNLQEVRGHARYSSLRWQVILRENPKAGHHPHSAGSRETQQGDQSTLAGQPPFEGGLDTIVNDANNHCENR